MKKLLILLFPLILLTSCATALRGTKESVTVITEPTSARLELSNGQMGTSPHTFLLNKKDPVTVKAIKQGYEPTFAEINPKLTGEAALPAAGNLILGPVGAVVGGAIDLNSGAMYNLEPNPLIIRLIRKGEGVLLENIDYLH